MNWTKELLDGSNTLLWLASGTYRSLAHRHDGTYLASDESERKVLTAGSLVELDSKLKQWPLGAEVLPAAKWIKVRQ